MRKRQQRCSSCSGRSISSSGTGDVTNSCTTTGITMYVSDTVRNVLRARQHMPGHQFVDMHMHPRLHVGIPFLYYAK